MNYEQGIALMKRLCNQNQKGQFEPYPGIVINYPGGKNSGDYQLSLEDSTMPTHADISLKLHELITSGTHTFSELEKFLIDVYSNGTATSYSSNFLERLKHLIFWITLQEDINYPRSEGFAGINLPYCRYYEAIYSTQPGSTFTIETVQQRCNNHGSSRPTLFNLQHAPRFYTYK